eukprot:3565361-Amphidinium_carterae.1
MDWRSPPRGHDILYIPDNHVHPPSARNEHSHCILDDDSAGTYASSHALCETHSIGELHPGLAADGLCIKTDGFNLPAGHFLRLEIGCLGHRSNIAAAAMSFSPALMDARCWSSREKGCP